MYNEKTIEKLKQKILDLAIRGKLVPQDPGDEPASILIEKIRKEKEKLTKEGKIKKPKEDSFIFKGSDNCYYENVNGEVKCIQDEIPFEIPESWVWCRLGNIFNVIMGQSPLGNSISEFVDGMEFHQGKLFFGNKYLKNSNTKTTMPTKISNENSVLLCIRAPVGKVNINKRKICIGRGLCSIEHNKYFLPELLYYFFLNFEQYFIKKSTGSTFKSITNEVVMNLILPIPPLKEQNNIVIKCNELLDLIDNIQKEYDNTNKIIKSLKNKLLDFIFSSNSSYRSYYENRISTNLEEYIGKSDIGDGDWVLSENMDDKGNIKLVQLKHIGSGNYIDKPYCKINNSFFEQNKCSEIKEDYLLINRLVSDKMNVCIMPNIQSKCITSVDVCWIKPNKRYLTKYLMYYLMAPCFQKEVLNLCSGSTRKRISKKNLIKIPMLIHSFKDQKEIVKKIDNIFTLIDNM